MPGKKIAVAVRATCFAALWALAVALPVAHAGSAPVPGWTLLADGLARNGPNGQPRKLTFGMSRAAALAAVIPVSGRPLKVSTYPDCGQSMPMDHADFRGGLSLLFLEGRFSGWEVSDNANPPLRTALGIGIGATRAALTAAYPHVQIAEESLGLMFTSEGAPSGFLDRVGPKGRVTSLYAGETCAIS